MSTLDVKQTKHSSSRFRHDVCFKAIAIDSQLKYMDGILTKIKIIKYNLLIFILFIHFRINIYMVLNINS